MRLRFQTFLPLLSAHIILTPNPLSWCGQVIGQASATAKIVLLVRDGRGSPVSGLKPDDFIVTERGVKDTVSSVEGFHMATPDNPVGSPGSGEQATTLASHQSVNDSPTFATYVLLIITPMSATGRDDALREAIHFLSKPEAEKWQIAFLDGAGSYVPFGQSVEQLKTILHGLSKHVTPPQYVGGSWFRKSNRAIGELGVMPGRRAIVVVSDYESKMPGTIGQNPWLLRVGPSMLIDSALRAQAGLYTVQSSGPATVVPFGSAAAPEFEGFQTGQDVAKDIRNETVTLGALRSDFLYAADATGGMPVIDLKDAFNQIAEDAAGSYVVNFIASPNEADGAWHPVAVSMREPHLRVRGPGYYEAPIARNTAQLPDGILKALEGGGNYAELQVAARAWLFPDSRSGIHNGALAADVDWIDKRTPGPDSRLQLFAELVNDATHATAGSWFEESDWPAERGQPLRFHWQRAAPIYPGSYTLKVIAMDTASGNIGSNTFSFMAHPLEGQALRFGAIVLAKGCLSANELAASRQNLLDPLLWEGCELDAAPANSFKASQDLKVLVRMYPPDEQMAKLITRQWKAFAVVDGDKGNGKISPLPVVAAEVRGLAAFGTVALSGLRFSPGPHQLTVVFEDLNGDGRKVQIPLSTNFSIEP